MSRIYAYILLSGFDSDKELTLNVIENNDIMVLLNVSYDDEE